MFAIEVGGGAVEDEELGCIGVFPFVGHGDYSSSVVGEGAVEFVFEGFVPDGGAAAACSRRVAALEHEVADGAVEGDGVVVSFFCELDEIVNGFGGVFGEEFEG